MAILPPVVAVTLDMQRTKLICCTATTATPTGAMDVDEAKPAAAAGDAKDKAAGGAAEGTGDASTATSADGAADKDKEPKEKEKEPSSFTITAPCRVVPHQVKHVSLPAGMRVSQPCLLLLVSRWLGLATNACASFAILS